MSLICGDTLSRYNDRSVSGLQNYVCSIEMVWINLQYSNEISVIRDLLGVQVAKVTDKVMQTCFSWLFSSRT